MTAAQARPIKSEGVFGRTRSYVSTFEVITDDVDDGPITAAAASGIPLRGDSYTFGNDYDTWCFAQEAKATLRSADETRKIWTVTVEYLHPDDQQAKDESTTGNYQDPVDMGWKISGSFSGEQVPTVKDKDGALIANSAEQVFLDPPLMKDANVDTLILSKNTATIDLSVRAELIGKVNEVAIWGLEPRQVKLRRWDYQIQWYGNGDSYVSNTWEFAIKSQKSEIDASEIGWTDELLDQGNRYIINAGENDPQKRYADIIRAGRVTVERLDGNGQVLDADDPPEWLQFKVEDEVDFTDYDFPDPLPGPFV